MLVRSYVHSNVTAVAISHAPLHSMMGAQSDSQVEINSSRVDPYLLSMIRPRGDDAAKHRFRGFVRLLQLKQNAVPAEFRLSLGKGVYNGHGAWARFWQMGHRLIRFFVEPSEWTLTPLRAVLMLSYQ